MKLLPSLQYSGLLIVLGRPSRFDHQNNSLLSGIAGQFFDACMSPISRHQCVVVTSDEFSIFDVPEGTKVILALGQESLSKIDSTISLAEQRGSHLVINNIICLPTYAPQEAYDLQDYEGKFNASLQVEFEDESLNGVVEEKSTHGKTKRKNWRFWLRCDVKKAVRLLQRGVEDYPVYNIILWPHFDVVVKELTNFKHGNLYFDIETDSQLQMTCFGYSNDRMPGVTVVPMLQTYFKERQYYYDKLQMAKILAALCAAFKHNCVVGHNLSFDLFVLAYRYGIPFPSVCYDTMLSHHRAYPEVEKSLGHSLSLFTDLPYHKNEGVFEPHNFAQTEQLYRYNAKDVYALKILKQKQDEHLFKIKAVESAAQANSMLRPYLTAQFQGIKIDLQKRAELMNETARRKKQIDRIASLLTGMTIPPKSKAKSWMSSWQLVAKYLYNGMGYSKPDKDITSEPVLLQHQLKHNNPALTLILAYRGQAHLNSQLKFEPWSFIRKLDKLNEESFIGPTLLTQQHDRATTQYKLTGTNTFRLSSSKVLGQWGTNMQNWDKKSRVIFQADEGKTMFQIDQSGAEALIVAYLCRPGNFRDLFLNNVKPHVFVALHLFSEEWKKELPDIDLTHFLKASSKELQHLPRWKELDTIIKKSDEWPGKRRYYHLAKMVCHASNYGMKAPTFRTNVLEKSEGKVVLTLHEAQYFLSTYHRLFPEIQEWHIRVQKQLNLDGRYLRNLFGFPRLFTGHWGDELHKEAYAFVPQSTVGTITNLCFVDTQNRIEMKEGLFKKAELDIYQNNHDSVLCQCKTEFAKEVYPEVQKFMNRELKSPWGETFFMKSGVAIGPNWGELKEVK